MKLTSASLLTFVGLWLLDGVAGQNLANQPPCVKFCINQLLNSGNNGCQQADANCICSDKTLISNASCCIFKHCAPSKREEASQFADKICRIAGVTNLPQTASCPSTSSAGVQSSPTSAQSSNNGAAKPTGFPGVGAMGVMGGAALGLAGFLI